MSLSSELRTPARYSVFEPAQHSLHECQNADEFRERFLALTGRTVENVAADVLADTAEKAIFLVGSLPLGMATAGSDVDFIVVVDAGTQLLPHEGGGVVNDDQRFAFANDSSLLVAGTFVTLMNGIAVEVQVANAPTINRICRRLRARGPELSESEIMTLGRLSRGWLLWESEGFLGKTAVSLRDPALDVYCSTKHFVSAEIFIRKAGKVLDLQDVPLALHLGRSSVEMAYLAYFASEGYSYLGAKWLAQLGRARGAAARVSRHPLLEQSLGLLFPRYASTVEETRQYLQEVSVFLRSMRELIEQKTLFRIAFHACPQIHDVPRSRRG